MLFQGDVFRIEIEERDQGIEFVFTFCGDATGEPFVDRLIVERTRPSDEAGTMCEFESPSATGVLTKSWRYGEQIPGASRCWPLSEGTYFVTAFGSGTGETKFSLKKRWFGSGFKSTILMGGCKGDHT